MNYFLDAAPNAEVIQGPLACMLSLIDMCDRPPVAANVEPGAVHDIGGHPLPFFPPPPPPPHRAGPALVHASPPPPLACDPLSPPPTCPAASSPWFCPPS